MDKDGDYQVPVLFLCYEAKIDSEWYCAEALNWVEQEDSVKDSLDYYGSRR